MSTALATHLTAATSAAVFFTCAGLALAQPATDGAPTTADGGPTADEMPSDSAEPTAPVDQPAAPAVAPADASLACGDVATMRSSAAALVEIGPRSRDSQGSRAAMAYLRGRLEAFGLSVKEQHIGQVTVNKISVGPWTIRDERVVNSGDKNLYVRFGGDGPARIFVAHYDTVPESPGAVDNAVGVAILLELARCFSSQLPPGPVIIAFTGAEEVGLVGARRLAKTLEGRLELAVSLDLIGHQTNLALNGLGPRWSRSRLSWLKKRVEAADAEADVPLFHRLVSRKLPQLERSDHAAFAAVGVPSLHLYGRGADRIHLAYHTPLDNMNEVTDEAIDNAFKLTRELATAHDALPRKSEDAGLWIQTPIGPFVASAYIILALEIVLAIAAAVLVMLCWARRRLAIRERAIGVLGVFLVFCASFLIAAIANVVAGMVNGNPNAAIHEPLRFILASLGLAVGVGAGLTMLANRWAFFIRGTRYHSYAAFITLVLGIALLGFGAIELAWQPLLASALFALAGFQLNRPILCSVATAIGVLIALPPLILPGFLREAVFHGFYPSALPLAGYLALAALPSWFAVFGALRARLTEPDRTVTIILAIALVLALVVSTLGLILPEAVCSAAELESMGLACELK